MSNATTNVFLATLAVCTATTRLFDPPPELLHQRSLAWAAVVCMVPLLFALMRTPWAMVGAAGAAANLIDWLPDRKIEDPIALISGDSVVAWNVADMAIMIGAIGTVGVLVERLRVRRREEAL